VYRQGKLAVYKSLVFWGSFLRLKSKISDVSNITGPLIAISENIDIKLQTDVHPKDNTMLQVAVLHIIPVQVIHRVKFREFRVGNPDFRV
jgi:hypothetical protein